VRRHIQGGSSETRRGEAMPSKRARRVALRRARAQRPVDEISTRDHAKFSTQIASKTSKETTPKCLSSVK